MKARPVPSHNESKEFTAYADLLASAHDEGLKSVATQLFTVPNDENGRLAIVKATVETEKGHFEGLGDADPSSVEADFAPHLIRVAETRAKARALRDAVNCGLVSFEELDGARHDRPSQPPGSGLTPPGSGATTRRPNGRNGSPARSRGGGPTRSRQDNGPPEPMSEAQRRYLFRLMAGQGFHKEAAEEELKDRFQVDSLGSVTKPQATKLIDELLGTSSRSGERSGTAADF